MLGEIKGEMNYVESQKGGRQKRGGGELALEYPMAVEQALSLSDRMFLEIIYGQLCLSTIDCAKFVCHFCAAI